MTRLAIFSAIIIVLLGLAGFFIGLPMATQSGLKSILNTAGLENAAVQSSRKIPGGTALDGIALDSKNLNTIQSLILQDGKDGKNLTIDKLALTGNWEGTALPDIAGWSLPFSMSKLTEALHKQKISGVSLNGGRIDLILPLLGVVRVEAKGQLNILEDGTARLQAVLWSDEKQLKGQVNVTGEFSANGLASVDFEIADGKLNLPSLFASRMGGWFILNKTADTAPWSLSSQIVAGSARLYTLPLRGATLSVQGTTQISTVNLQSAGMEGETAIAIDAKLGTNQKKTLTAAIRTDNILQLFYAVLTGGDSETKPTSQPGNILYAAEADKVAALFTGGTFTISDLAGETWLKGGLRKTETGADLDIQQVAMKNLAATMGLEKLNTEGLMTGLISLRRNENGGAIIDQGLMRGTSMGILSFNGKTLPMESGRKDILDVLKSFAYDRVELSINSVEAKQLEGTITMTGHPVLNLDQKPTQLKLKFQDAI